MGKTYEDKKHNLEKGTYCFRFFNFFHFLRKYFSSIFISVLVFALQLSHSVSLCIYMGRTAWSQLQYSYCKYL
jgi:hypothetical protein